MFGVVVLHITVIMAKTINEGQKCFLKDLGVERGTHYPIENTHSCSSPDAYSSPDVHFDGMFCPIIDEKNFSNTIEYF